MHFMCAEAAKAHILHANCPCGFERKLSPGSGIAADGFFGYTITYNADESDLLTEDDAIIKSHTIRDPFVSENFEPKGPTFARNVKQLA
jgi:hypothetical protein